VNLWGANLVDANLRQVHLERANLDEANLARANFDGAWYDASTTWPDEFDPRGAGARSIEDYDDPKLVGPSD
jgi:hypothetical protein